MKIIGWILIALLMLAGASYITTVTNWDGGYPPAEVLIRFQADGKPIDGIGVSVSSKGKPRYRYPLYEFTSTHSPKSDKQGNMVLHQTKSGMQFGGKDWKLFWIYRVGYSGPKFECTFTHPSYATRRIPFEELFSGLAKDWKCPRKEVVLDGKTNDMLVVEKTIEMKRTGNTPDNP